MAAGSVEYPGALSPSVDFGLDLDHLLESFSHEGILFDLSSDICVPDSPPPASTPTEEKCDSSPDTVSSYVGDLEKFLMEAEEDSLAIEGFDVDDFFAGLFSEGSRDGEGEVATPNSEAAVESDRKEEEKSEEMPVPAPEAVDGEDDNPVNKKLRRQIRNRDSAMKSRERKKLYVKELEKKSKYLEAECRRLDYTLRCFAAENLVLRQCLQKDKLYDASETKQESAVLFVESLLLGSLLWLVSIVCLFLLPGLPNLDQKDPNHLVKDLDQEIVGLKTITNKKLETYLGFGLGVLGKRSRGTRARMKRFCSFCMRLSYRSSFLIC